MTFRLPTLLALSSLLSLGCSGTVIDSPDPDGRSSGGSNGTVPDEPILGSPETPDSTPDSSWQLIQPCTASAPTDAINVFGHELKGNTLTLFANHGGGCAQHAYGLCYSQEWAESYPVQIGLTLLHDANGDNCEADLSVDLEFDLTPLENAYNEAYQSDGGAISLSVDGESFVHRFGSELDKIATWEEIDQALDELNSCETVTDCERISTRPCEGAYINAGADTSRVKEMIEARNSADGYSGGIGCDAACACGSLSCEAGKCVAAASGCEEPANGAQMICL